MLVTVAGPFEAALAHPAIHAIEHACFLGTGLLFWSAVIHPRPRLALGRSVLYLFLISVHTPVLGALLAVSRLPWYAAYASRATTFGLTPLEAQQLAGLIMWIPAGLIYLTAALLIARRWLQASESSVRRREARDVVSMPLPRSPTNLAPAGPSGARSRHARCDSSPTP